MTSTLTRRALLGKTSRHPDTASDLTLIRGADLLTMDSAQGERLHSDLLIEGGTIAKIGPHLTAPGARIVEAAGMILMPGFVDGYRHVWQTAVPGGLAATDQTRYKPATSTFDASAAKTLTPDATYLASYVGALRMIDCGITSTLDDSRHLAAPEAALRGLKDAGIGGIFCLPLQKAEASAGIIGDKAAPLRLGISLDMLDGDDKAALDARLAQIARARALSPALLTQPARHIRRLDDAGALGAALHFTDAENLADDELRMMSDAGAKLCSLVLAEFASAAPQIHGRARSSGVDAGIGTGNPACFPGDFFEHIRNTFWSLGRTRESTAILAEYASDDTLAFATSLGARSLGLGVQTGMLAVGKRADMLLLRTDRIGLPALGPLADRIVGFASYSDIDSVWVGGRCRKAGGRMVATDWTSLKRKLAQVHRPQRGA